MRYKANSPADYIEQLPEPRKTAVAALRNAIRDGLPEGFQETMQYDMITYVVPLSIHPIGYRVNPNDPLPFLSIGSQKHHISLYHMGLYIFPEVQKWFKDEYEKAGVGNLDMGKSCIRFKREGKIPFDLITKLCKRISVEDYIERVTHG